MSYDSAVTSRLRSGGKVEPQQQSFLAARLEKSVGLSRSIVHQSLGMKFVPLADVRISVWETRGRIRSVFPRERRHYEPADFQQAPTHPVVKVNWFDAMAFCKMADRQGARTKI